MAQEAHKAENKESMFERVFEHHHHNHPEGDRETKHGDESGHHSKLRDTLKKDEDELNEYYQEDKELEREGKTYGGLM
ncbi:Uncharacterized protein PECH_006464 [Penicillium ucsense]|uniref:Uncharacterized protein n=1 Tax=Penicillium ucsense TaxID=2839758 RepID=A0A8J8W644_9EURO|nr:Uncharacterized protein PECM_004208 [Penicillium ucsense]KAF7735656.1 Uncharacterized protein PECH_006464 [Penicillium ucsense]